MAGVVSNASPLILLSLVERLDVLNDLFGEVMITPEVQHEVVERGQGRAGAKEVPKASYIRVANVTDLHRIADIRDKHRLGQGEASTLALAQEQRATYVLMDDRRARVAAGALGLTVAGTVRVLELAYEKQILTDLRTVYLRLVQSSGRLAPAVLNGSLSKLGLLPLS